MAQVSRPSFSDPSYVTRLSVQLGPVVAGSGGVTTKFVAHANLVLFDLTTYQTVAGTSTYTVNGTATVNGQQISLIVIQNANAFSTNSAFLSTATYGPFLAGGGFVSGGTGTGQVGGAGQFSLNTAGGLIGQGGITVSAGAQFYCVSGTDATAVNSCTIGYQIKPGAGLTV